MSLVKEDRALRLIAILQALPRSGYRTSKQLMSLLEQRGILVQKRMMERDLHELSASRTFGPHIVLKDDAKPYQWQLSKECDLIMPELDSDIAAIWDLVGHHLAYILPESAQQKVQPQITSARRYLKERSAGVWNKKVAFLPRGLLKPASVPPAVREAVYEALVEGRVLHAEYRNKQGAERLADLHMQGLVNRGSVTYVVAMWDDYEDVRHLALHRLLRARKTGAKARQKEDFELSAYLRSGAFDIKIDHASGPALVKLRFYNGAGEHLEETPLTSDQKVTRVNGSTVECEARIEDSQELRWWILGFGEHVEVLEPKSLRKVIASQLTTAVARYQE